MGIGHAALTAGAVALTLGLSAIPARAGTSKLWGTEGEAWDERGRLPDFSYAGYRGGAAPLPEVPVVANVRDFGAAGDGTTDDTDAFLAAIDAATDGAILIPAGRYLITDILRIRKSRVVLRGEGSGADGSVLYIPRSLSDVLGPAQQWSWSGGFIWVDPGETGTALTEVSAAALRGDRALRVSRKDALAPGQLVALHLTDDGTGSLGRHLHADQSEAGDCSYMVPLVLDWPVRVAQIEDDRIELAQPLRADVRLAWTPEIHALPALEEVGVERLRIEFIETPYAGHNMEPGYNGIAFTNGVVDSWVRDVSIVNADSGIFTESLVKNVTLRQIELGGRGGHHGFAVSLSSDVLVEDFVVNGSWIHALTVTHRSNGTVFSRGTGDQPLSLDHHGDVPFESLFTEVGPFDYVSSGNACTRPHAGARNTYWNLAAPMQAPLLWAEMQTNVIGDLAIGDSMTDVNEWFENVQAIEPANLYEAQLGRRLCGDGFDTCNGGVFDAESGVCVQQPREDDAPCDGGDPDEQGYLCKAGVCASGENGGGGGCGVAAPRERGAPWLLLIGALVLRARARRERGEPAAGARRERRRLATLS
ncbi:glycosyl hydrolase family 28-related protein [Sorangium sp. So ce1000]|uniref:glycosyl hydrolase family 28-related protein n=1 Tax=Sorangium sp. So ce1000 TaxID=3133325 RepID=UPI003F624B47